MNLKDINPILKVIGTSNGELGWLTEAEVNNTLKQSSEMEYLLDMLKRILEAKIKLLLENSSKALKFMDWNENVLNGYRIQVTVKINSEEEIIPTVYEAWSDAMEFSLSDALQTQIALDELVFEEEVYAIIGLMSEVLRKALTAVSDDINRNGDRHPKSLDGESDGRQIRQDAVGKEEGCNEGNHA